MYRLYCHIGDYCKEKILRTLRDFSTEPSFRYKYARRRNAHFPLNCLDATNNAYMKLHYEKFASNMKLHYEEFAVLRRKPRPRHCTAPGDIFTPTRITPV